MCCLKARGSAGIGRYPVPRQHMIEVVLHVENVVLDNETQRHYTPPDHTAVAQMFFRNAFNKMREQGIVSIPEIDEGAPLQVPVSMRLDPFVLRVTLPAKFAVDRGQRETDMIVRRRIDQVAQFFFPRPASGPSICLRRRFVGKRAKVGKLTLKRFPEQEGKILWHSK